MIDTSMRHSVRQVLAWLVLTGPVFLADPVWAQSDISACVNLHGQTRIIAAGQSCLPTEQLVVWAVQGPAGPPGPQGEPGAAGPSVVDSIGTRLGLYANPFVLMNVDGVWFTVFANRDGFSSPSFGMLFAFLTPDCTGTRYGAGFAGGGLVANAQVMGQIAWFSDLEAEPIDITGTPAAPGMFWFQQIGPDGPVGSCSPNPVFTSIQLLPMRAVNVSGFTPPFRVSSEP